MYNVLTQRYNSILLGTVRNDLASTIANQGQSIRGGVTKTELNRAINGTSSSIGVEVAGVLQAGSTTLTIQNGLINTSSTIDVYTDKFGLCPKNIVISDKQVVLTFDAQSSNVSVKIRIA